MDFNYCCITKNKAITLANHNTRKQHNDQSEPEANIHVTGAERGKFTERIQEKPKQTCNYFRHSIENQGRSIYYRFLTYALQTDKISIYI